MKTTKLWKIVVEARLGIGEIEKAVEDVPEHPMSSKQGVVLQRIDVLKETCIVFVSGSEECVRSLEKGFKVPACGARIRSREASAAELYSNEPVAV